MFGFGKKKAPQEQADATRPGLFERLKSGLARTRHNFSDGLADLLLGRKQIDEDLLEEL